MIFIVVMFDIIKSSSIFFKITICTFIIIALIYLWIKIINLENDISILNNKYKQFSVVPNIPITEKKINEEQFKKEDFIMKEIFNCCSENGCSIKIPKQEPVKTFEDTIIPIDDIGSITLSSTEDKNNIKPNNKKQLQKLNLESLREKCIELELNSEGTKSELIERILQHTSQ